MLIVENEVKVPIMYWYQNSSAVFVKIEAPGCEDNNIKINDNKLQLNKKTENINFLVNLELEDSIKDFKIHTAKFSVHLELYKNEEKWWNKLSNSSEYKRFIKADWDNWVEEDDEEENMMGGMPGMESMMGGMPGMESMMGGMPGMENMMGGMPDMMGDMSETIDDDTSDEIDDTENAQLDAISEDLEATETVEAVSEDTEVTQTIETVSE